MTLPRPRPVDPRTVRGPDGIAPEPTDAGQDRPGTVDEALAGLHGLAERPLPEHVAVFEQIHTALQDALAAESGAGEAAGRT
jgi:hypothetical protein